MPFILENYIDLQKEFRTVEKQRLSNVTEMAEYYREYHLWNDISKIKVVLMRMYGKKRVSGVNKREK